MVEPENFSGTDYSSLTEHLPNSPGVYLMKDRAEEILYIGKANNIQSRVRSHFASGHVRGALYSRVCTIDFIITKNEVEALLLENSLIKEKQPRYNVRLKDDKRYPYLKLSLDETFPRLYLTRTIPRPDQRSKGKTKALFFGPYPQVGEARRILEALLEVFPLRSCKIASSQLVLPRPCLEYEMHRCLAPCVARLCGQEEYRSLAMKVRNFLEGNHQQVKADLEKQMLSAAEQLAFEKASIYRNALTALHNYPQRQAISIVEEDSEDYLAFARVGDINCVTCMRRRHGNIRGSESYFLEVEGSVEGSEILSAFIEQHYDEAPEIPRRILCSEIPTNSEVLETWLTATLAKKVDIKRPHRGPRLKILALATQNAEFRATEQYRKKLGAKKKIAASVVKLGQALNLTRLPLRIEGYDISHHRGEETVASMVVFENGVPHKSGYRRFQIRADTGGDDFRAMYEVIQRRFQHTDAEFGAWPDLVLIDGGENQLRFARQAMSDLLEDCEEGRRQQLQEMQTISLAKQNEEVFIWQPDGVVPGPKLDGTELHLLQQIRDESHRFAIDFHRKRKAFQRSRSQLEEVPGIGTHRAEALLTRFGSVKQIQSASPGEIAETLRFSELQSRQLLAKIQETLPQQQDDTTSSDAPCEESEGVLGK